jgi:hypothetical protein
MQVTIFASSILVDLPLWRLVRPILAFLFQPDSIANSHVLERLQPPLSL